MWSVANLAYVLDFMCEVRVAGSAGSHTAEWFGNSLTDHWISTRVARPKAIYELYFCFLTNAFCAGTWQAIWIMNIICDFSQVCLRMGSVRWLLRHVPLQWKMITFSHAMSSLLLWRTPAIVITFRSSHRRVSISAVFSDSTLSSPFANYRFFFKAIFWDFIKHGTLWASYQIIFERHNGYRNSNSTATSSQFLNAFHSYFLWHHVLLTRSRILTTV